MAHPYESSRADKVGKSRADSFTKGYATGGSVAKKGGSPTSSKTATKTSTVANPKGNVTVTGGAGDGDTHVTVAKKKGGGEVNVQGRATGGRLDKFARGGKTKKHGTQVNIAVVSPSHGGPPSAGGGAPAGGGLPAPGGPLSMMPPKPPPPPMPPPGAGGPPGMPMKPPGMMKRGGKVTGQKGGADSGVGRLDKVKMQKGK